MRIVTNANKIIFLLYNKILPLEKHSGKGPAINAKLLPSMKYMIGPIIYIYIFLTSESEIYQLLEMPETTSAFPPPNEVPIHWELIGMDQDNATLIEAIRKKVVWYPPSASNSRKNTNLNLQYNNEIISGQFGQPLHVEKLLQQHTLWVTLNFQSVAD